VSRGPEILPILQFRGARRSSSWTRTHRPRNIDRLIYERAAARPAGRRGSCSAEKEIATRRDEGREMKTERVGTRKERASVAVTVAIVDRLGLGGVRLEQRKGSRPSLMYQFPSHVGVPPPRPDRNEDIFSSGYIGLSTARRRSASTGRTDDMRRGAGSTSRSEPAASGSARPLHTRPGCRVWCREISWRCAPVAASSSARWRRGPSGLEAAACTTWRRQDSLVEHPPKDSRANSGGALMAHQALDHSWW